MKSEKKHVGKYLSHFIALFLLIQTVGQVNEVRAAVPGVVQAKQLITEFAPKTLPEERPALHSAAHTMSAQLFNFTQRKTRNGSGDLAAHLTHILSRVVGNWAAKEANAAAAGQVYRHTSIDARVMLARALEIFELPKLPIPEMPTEGTVATPREKAASAPRSTRDLALIGYHGQLFESVEGFVDSGVAGESVRVVVIDGFTDEPAGRPRGLGDTFVKLIAELGPNVMYLASLDLGTGGLFASVLQGMKVNGNLPDGVKLIGSVEANKLQNLSGQMTQEALKPFDALLVYSKESGIRPADPMKLAVLQLAAQSGVETRYYLFEGRLGAAQTAMQALWKGLLSRLHLVIFPDLTPALSKGLPAARAITELVLATDAQPSTDGPRTSLKGGVVPNGVEVFVSEFSSSTGGNLRPLTLEVSGRDYFRTAAQEAARLTAVESAPDRETDTAQAISKFPGRLAALAAGLFPPSQPVSPAHQALTTTLKDFAAEVGSPVPTPTLTQKPRPAAGGSSSGRQNLPPSIAQALRSVDDKIAQERARMDGVQAKIEAGVDRLLAEFGNTRDQLEVLEAEHAVTRVELEEARQREREAQEQLNAVQAELASAQAKLDEIRVGGKTAETELQRQLEVAQEEHSRRVQEVLEARGVIEVLQAEVDTLKAKLSIPNEQMEAIRDPLDSVDGMLAGIIGDWRQKASDRDTKQALLAAQEAKANSIPDPVIRARARNDLTPLRDEVRQLEAECSRLEAVVLAINQRTVAALESFYDPTLAANASQMVMAVGQDPELSQIGARLLAEYPLLEPSELGRRLNDAKTRTSDPAAIEAEVKKGLIRDGKIPK